VNPQQINQLKVLLADGDEAMRSLLQEYLKRLDVNGVAILWSSDFVVSAIEKLHPDMELLPLDSYQKDSHYLTQDDKAYLRFFLSIAKKQAPLQISDVGCSPS
jgi:hypothetical protein